MSLEALSSPLTSNHMDFLYPALLRQVLAGEKIVTRGQVVVEVRPFIFRLENPLNRLVTLPERKVNRAFAVAEMLQTVALTEDSVQLARFNSNWATWVDPLTHQVEVPYGAALKNQLGPLLAELRKDPGSRRAVMTIYDGQRHQADLLNVPCTLSLQFFVRNRRVELVASMRSNDLWWGTPYDAFQFTALQELVAHDLDLEMGPYTHVAGSGHLYEPMWEKAEALCERYSSVIGMRAQMPLFPHFRAAEIIAEARKVLDIERAVAVTTPIDQVWTLDKCGLSQLMWEHLQTLVGYQDRRAGR